MLVRSILIIANFDYLKFFLQNILFPPSRYFPLIQSSEKSLQYVLD